MATKYPKTEIVDHRLRVDGCPDSFVQGAVRTLWLVVTDLRCYSGYAGFASGEMTGGTRISGGASFQRAHESIRVAGVEGLSTKTFSFSVRTASEDSYPDWTITIGFNSADRDIGLKDEWWIECYVPQEAFDKLLSYFLDGKVNTINLGCKTDAWVTSGDWYAQVGDWVTWYLQPQEYSPEPARGKIIQFSWELAPRPVPPPVPDDADTPESRFAHAPPLAEPSPRPPPAANRVRWDYVAAVLAVIVVILILK